MQSFDDPPPLLWRGCPVERFAADARVAEHGGHPVRERNRRREHERLASGRVLPVGREYVRGRGCLLERVFECVSVEVPTRPLDCVEVDLFQPDADAANVGQVAGADHLRDPALVHDLLPHLAELLAVRAGGGGGSPTISGEGDRCSRMIRR